MKYFNEQHIKNNPEYCLEADYRALIVAHIGEIDRIVEIDSEYKALKAGLIPVIEVAPTTSAVEAKPAYEFKVTPEESDQVQAKAHELKALHMRDVTIKICGKWIWIEGNTKPYAKLLGKTGAGCRWCPKKQCWSWHVGKYFKRGKTLAMPEIETRFGAVKL